MNRIKKKSVHFFPNHIFSSNLKKNQLEYFFFLNPLDNWPIEVRSSHNKSYSFTFSLIPTLKSSRQHSGENLCLSAEKKNQEAWLTLYAEKNAELTTGFERSDRAQVRVLLSTVVTGTPSLF